MTAAHHDEENNKKKKLTNFNFCNFCLIVSLIYLVIYSCVLYNIYSPPFRFQVDSFDVSSMNIVNNNNNNYYSADIDLTLSVKRTRYFTQTKVFESLQMVLEYRHWNISSSIKLEPFYQENGRKIKLRVRVRDVQLENIAVDLLAKDLVGRRALPFALIIEGKYWDIDSGDVHGCPMNIACEGIMVKFLHPYLRNGTMNNTPLVCETNYDTNC